MRHRMVCGAENDVEVLLVCPECGRRVVWRRQPRRIVVLDRGDVFASHVWGEVTVGGVDPYQ